MKRSVIVKTNGTLSASLMILVSLIVGVPAATAAWVSYNAIEFYDLLAGLFVSGAITVWSAGAFVVYAGELMRLRAPGFRNPQ